MMTYNQVEEKRIQKVVCNCCGKEIPVNNGMMKEDVLHVEKEWGYFSNKDGEMHQFDLCEECYNRIISSFKYEIEVKEK